MAKFVQTFFFPRVFENKDSQRNTETGFASL